MSPCCKQIFTKKTIFPSSSFFFLNRRKPQNVIVKRNSSEIFGFIIKARKKKKIKQGRGSGSNNTWIQTRRTLEETLKQKQIRVVKRNVGERRIEEAKSLMSSSVFSCSNSSKRFSLFFLLCKE